MFKFTWRQAGGLKECPYFYRTIFQVGKYSIRFHEWLADDDVKAMHDHPHWFLTLVLWGGYTDLSEDGEDRLRMGSIRFRPAEFKHSVTKVKHKTYTLLLVGPRTRRWGFWVDGKLIKRDKYFAVHGHHPCDGDETPVRMKPGGERIKEKK